jgi:UDP-N-acetylmuramyl pentapeptide phosphotransferase/UDP-N-acetylglucosamine-1-phosphate transferase
LSFVVSFWLTAKFSKSGSYLYILDYPNARSLHSRPVPRGGGVAILVGIYLIGIFALYDVAEMRLIAIAFATLLLAAIAFIDDRTGLSPVIRIAVHLGVAIGLVASGLWLEEIELPGMRFDIGGWLGAVVTAAFVVWLINLYNFMDGIDGLAAGMAVFGFGALAAMGWLEGQPGFFLLSTIIAAAAAGFLIFNFPPARIFMGDVGSSSLGLLAAAVSVWGAVENIFPLWSAILVFSPFITDATVTLLRRLVRGEKIWEAHRSHYYQRLVRLGLGHRKTVLFQYGLMVGCGASAIAGREAPAGMQWLILVGWISLYSAYFSAVSLFERRNQRAAGP